MSSELHKYIETSLEKKQNLFNADVLNFPKNKKIENSQNLSFNSKTHWNINDNANNDQLKAVTGICFMLSVLLLVGLFSNLNIFS
jgi:hypothetical protein|tara:strand:- start:229 stop:483 length:255 start_codon:yes stop_codon:yes gene_type:complete